VTLEAMSMADIFFRYYGVDWAVTATVFLSISLVGEKKRVGFLIGIASAVLAMLFSYQIRSVANGVTSAVIFALYLRGFLKWRDRSE
jgi:hypothetical protein